MNRWIWTGAITAAVASCIAALVFLPDSPEREIARLNQQIEIDLPLGTNAAEVEKWLLKGRELEFHITPGADDRTRRIFAQTHREYFWYWSGYLCISFSFDEQDCLVEHVIFWEDFPL